MPESLTIIRHGESTYNALAHQKAVDPLYADFVMRFGQLSQTALESDVLAKGWEAPADLLALARELQARYALGASDFATPLTEEGRSQAAATGAALRRAWELPEVILYSPYLRTKQTLEGLIEGWPELASVTTYEEDRLREQDYGAADLYNDWRLFNLNNPQQAIFYRQQGRYRYRYPEGESISDVKERVRSLLESMIREQAGLKVLCVSHHITKLAIRSNLERLTPEEVLRIDRDEKPINCGVTVYRGDTGARELVLLQYNRKLY